jgi:putative restriction endonuclease
VHGRPRPYDDEFEESGLLRYRYRGADPNHRDNVGLREIMRRNMPLIYFHGIAKGRYMTCWPAYLVHDNPSDLCFSVALDDRTLARKEITLAETDESLVRRSYVTALVRRRMHQQTFRARVLQAYRAAAVS